MNYFWVNQNQTFNQEMEGGYMWSPKRHSNGARNPFYEFMRTVVPGDIVFSFAGTLIQSIGIIQSNAYGTPRPREFGRIGAQWSNEGWKVDVKYFLLKNKIRPAEHMANLEKLLPNKFSPLQRSGRGNQGIYLTRLPEMLAFKLFSLIGNEAMDLINKLNVIKEDAALYMPNSKGLNEWEEFLEDSLKDDKTLKSTEKRSLILARRGQGLFKQNVSKREKECRVTGVNEIVHLRASHI